MGYWRLQNSSPLTFRIRQALGASEIEPAGSMDLRFRVWFRVGDLGFRIWGSRFKA